MKKSKKSKEKSFSKEDVQAALTITHSEYFSQVIALLSHTDQEELNYVKVPVVTPNGGTYLISILHIDGPTINLQSLAKMVENSEKENG